jgi:16S rRNA (guanine966-N2)-methyltransferase
MDIRPTSDRLRETLFNVLTAGNRGALEGSIWLDLYAGTGAVGIEALSRGAATGYFVEQSAAAVKVIRENLGSLGISEGFEVIQSDVAKALARLKAAAAEVDFIFLDPPYRLEAAYRETLDAIGAWSSLNTRALVIAEHQKKFDPGETFGTLARFRTLQQGDAALSFYQRVAMKLQTKQRESAESAEETC